MPTSLEVKKPVTPVPAYAGMDSGGSP